MKFLVLALANFRAQYYNKLYFLLGGISNGKSNRRRQLGRRGQRKNHGSVGRGLGNRDPISGRGQRWPYHHQRIRPLRPSYAALWHLLLPHHQHHRKRRSSGHPKAHRRAPFPGGGRRPRPPAHGLRTGPAAHALPRAPRRLRRGAFGGEGLRLHEKRYCPLLLRQVRQSGHPGLRPLRRCPPAGPARPGP